MTQREPVRPDMRGSDVYQRFPRLTDPAYAEAFMDGTRWTIAESSCPPCPPPPGTTPPTIREAAKYAVVGIVFAWLMIAGHTTQALWLGVFALLDMVLDELRRISATLKTKR